MGEVCLNSDMRFRCLLMFGAPGAGKGTQGRLLGMIPGFFHMACGDVFRSLDVRTELGRKFLEYSSRGELVPDDLTLQLWRQQIQNMIVTRRFKPEVDRLVLDGIPRNVRQSELMDDLIEVQCLFYLKVSAKDALVERLKSRALKDNRLDDANEAVIRRRLEEYETETRPVLDFYGPEKVVPIDADRYPVQVAHDILGHIVRLG